MSGARAKQPAEPLGPRPQPAAGAAQPRPDETDAVEWIFGQVAGGHGLPVIEAEAVVNAIDAELRWGGRLFFPLLVPTDVSSFLHVHAVNVATISMALAESLQFDPASVRKIGLAALLTDVGLVCGPSAVWQKQGSLTAEEREVVVRHPVEGARLLLNAHASLDLAAVVAYEHHLRMDGSGYPRLAFPRSAHYVSRLVQICDVFCALSSPRPYRSAWPLEIIVSFIAERAGFEFHPTLASALTVLVKQHLTAHAAA